MAVDLKTKFSLTADILLGISALGPISTTAHYVFVGHTLPNPNYPKMQNEIGDMLLSIHAFLFLVILRILYAHWSFKRKLGAVRGGIIWLVLSVGLIAAWWLMFLAGVSTDGFLD
jgi:hypothetical protein